MNESVDECITPGLKPVDETVKEMLARISPVTGIEELEIESALDRILANEVTSLFDFPPWPASAMDGYAFGYSPEVQDKPLIMIGTALAGHPFPGSVGVSECVRITTGAPLPSGCDTVEMQENCSVDGTELSLLQSVTESQHVRQIGSSIKAGQTLLEAGLRLGPKELAVISSSGIDRVQVFKPLTIAVFTTGDELTQPGVALRPGQIYDSNRLTMVTMCRRMGFVVNDYGLVADDPDAIREVMIKASQTSDVLLTSGGVSVGDADYIKPILDEIGELDIWKVAIKPGKPIAIGRIGDCHFFGLPGNPVSTIVTLNKLVRPALQKLSGENVSQPAQFTAICLDDLRKARGRRDYQRGYATVDAQGHWQVNSTGPQGSGRLISVAEANCYIILEPDSAGVKAGEKVIIELFDNSLC